MKSNHYVSFCMMIVAGLFSLHLFSRESFSPAERLRSQLDSTARARDLAELRAQILAHELADYQQHVATLLPGALKSTPEEDAFPLRQLASVAGQGGDMIAIERASGLFESAKQQFRDKSFEDSNRGFDKLISRFPASSHVAGAHFLLAEGQFQLKEYSASVLTIERMVSLFPENDLTGFALLRLGDIFKSQDRLEDAADIYRAVLANFKQPELVRQATQNLKAIAL